MIALAQRSGVDASKIPEALSDGFADSKPLQILGPEMATEKFEPIKWKEAKSSQRYLENAQPTYNSWVGAE